MKIVVRILAKKEISFDVEGCDKIENVKAMIQDNTGKQLQDELSFSDYNIINGSVISCTRRISGGGLELHGEELVGVNIDEEGREHYDASGWPDGLRFVDDFQENKSVIYTPEECLKKAKAYFYPPTKDLTQSAENFWLACQRKVKISFLSAGVHVTSHNATVLLGNLLLGKITDENSRRNMVAYWSYAQGFHNFLNGIEFSIEEFQRRMEPMEYFVHHFDNLVGRNMKPVAAELAQRIAGGEEVMEAGRKIKATKWDPVKKTALAGKKYSYEISFG
uniref:Ubiquitin-like domain-containing protein n=1 Tax=Panagrolaimus sp. ES5 TaxID=591445 RepID=A0AC34FDU4_9BILA